MSADTDGGGDAERREETAIERFVKVRGPLTMDDAPVTRSFGETTWDDFRQRIQNEYPNIRLFWPHRSTPGSNSGDNSAFRPGVGHDRIIYHVGHDKKEVVRAYLDANPQMRGSAKSIVTITRQTEPRFATAMAAVCREMGLNPGDDKGIQDVNDDRDTEY